MNKEMGSTLDKTTHKSKPMDGVWFFQANAPSGQTNDGVDDHDYNSSATQLVRRKAQRRDVDSNNKAATHRMVVVEENACNVQFYGKQFSTRFK